MTRFKKGHLYIVKFLDHNESNDSKNPHATLNVVGKYIGTRKGYLILTNWFSDDLDESVQTRANVLKKAVVSVNELRET